MTILLVYDEARLRQTLARSLRARGYQVVEAATHREAVAAASARTYDLLLLAVNLPDATGWDVLRDGSNKARERAAETLAIVRDAMKIDYPELRGPRVDGQW